MFKKYLVLCVVFLVPGSLFSMFSLAAAVAHRRMSVSAVSRPAAEPSAVERGRLEGFSVVMPGGVGVLPVSSYVLARVVNESERRAVLRAYMENFFDRCEGGGAVRPMNLFILQESGAGGAVSVWQYCLGLEASDRPGSQKSVVRLVSSVEYPAEEAAVAALESFYAESEREAEPVFV
jgi:hypothetical protein